MKEEIKKTKIRLIEGSIYIGGITGSGKSVCARVLADKINGLIVVYDMKETKHWDNYGVHVKTVKHFIKHFNRNKTCRRYVIRPLTTIKTSEDIIERARADIEKLCSVLWRYKSKVYILIDELANAVRSNRDKPPNIKMWLILGRERKKI